MRNTPGAAGRNARRGRFATRHGVARALLPLLLVAAPATAASAVAESPSSTQVGRKVPSLKPQPQRGLFGTVPRPDPSPEPEPEPGRPGRPGAAPGESAWSLHADATGSTTVTIPAPTSLSPWDATFSGNPTYVAVHISGGGVSTGLVYVAADAPGGAGAAAGMAAPPWQDLGGPWDLPAGTYRIVVATDRPTGIRIPVSDGAPLSATVTTGGAATFERIERTFAKAQFSEDVHIPVMANPSTLAIVSGRLQTTGAQVATTIGVCFAPAGDICSTRDATANHGLGIGNATIVATSVLEPGRTSSVGDLDAHVVVESTVSTDARLTAWALVVDV